MKEKIMNRILIVFYLTLLQTNTTLLSNTVVSNQEKNDLQAIDSIKEDLDENDSSNLLSQTSVRKDLIIKEQRAGILDSVRVALVYLRYTYINRWIKALCSFLGWNRYGHTKTH